MNYKHKSVIVALVAVLSCLSFAPEAVAQRRDRDGVRREIRRAIRREIRDDIRDGIREAICEDAIGRKRRRCRQAERFDRIGDAIRRDINRRRILREIFD